MALTLVATPGAHTANTYSTLTEANAELLGYTAAITSAWDVATDPQKNAALVQATRQIDMARLRGDKYYNYEEGNDAWQPLHFPTTEDIYDSTLFIPSKVKAACAVQAAFLLRAGAAAQATQDMINAGIGSHGLGKLSESFNAGNASLLCPEALANLAGWLVKTVRVHRG